MILVQDILSFRQRAGHDIPHPRRVGVAVGRPQQQALVFRVIPRREGIEPERPRAPGFPGVQGDALLGVDPRAVAGYGHRAVLADLLHAFAVEVFNMHRVLESLGVVRRAAAPLHQHPGLFVEQVFVVGNQAHHRRQLLVVDEVRRAHRRRGYLALPEGLHAQRRGLLQHQSFRRELPALFRRRLAVRGIAHRRSAAAGNVHDHAFVVESAGRQDLRLFGPCAAYRLPVLRAPGRRFKVSVLPAAGRPSPGDVAVLFRHLHPAQLRPILIREDQGLSGGRDRPVRVERGSFAFIRRFPARAVYRNISAGLDLRPVRKRPFLRVLLAVAQVPSTDVHGLLPVVVQLHPVVRVPVFIGAVARHHLVDDHVRPGRRGQHHAQHAQRCQNDPLHVGIFAVSLFHIIVPGDPLAQPVQSGEEQPLGDVQRVQHVPHPPSQVPVNHIFHRVVRPFVQELLNVHAGRNH